ncbi:adenosine receptor A1-like [Chanodichthys erythropterus]|uniref:adenosine receptor A1-like n=1 Tax=Chanodichthys erythropterus TaxID=933992 RepID=UPI00351E08F4
MGVSVRLCLSAGSSAAVAGTRKWSTSACLKLCLSLVGSVGSIVVTPVSVLLNLRSSRCLYTCIAMVSCPLLVRQFTVCLLLLLTLNTHLQWRLGNRYAGLVTRRRVLCSVLLCWVISVITAFGQFIISNSSYAWGISENDDTAGLGMDEWPEENYTTPALPPKRPYPQDRSVIGQFLPYGGFLSKFLVEDKENFTYAEIHGSHWGVCATDTMLSPLFLVYVYAITVFVIPLLVLLAVYLDLMCLTPQQVPASSSFSQKQSSVWSRSLALSVSLLVMLCLPLHITHALLLFAPSATRPGWTSLTASVLFQTYSVVPPLLFTNTSQQPGMECSLLSVPNLTSRVITSRVKSVGSAFSSVEDYGHPGPTPKGKGPPGM